MPEIADTVAPVLALKCKTGELEALRHTDPNVVRRVTPLVELVDNIRDPDRGTMLPALVDCAARLLLHGRSLWIDPYRLPQDSSLGAGPGGAFGELDRRIEDELGLIPPEPPIPNFIPVVRAANADRECANIRLLQEHHPRPIAVRLEKPREHELFDTIRRIRGIAADSGVGAGEVHVIVDEEFVNEVDEHTSARAIAAIQWIADAVQPASLTLLSGCTPDGPKDYTPHLRTRADAQLWRVVAEAAHATAGIWVRYGDYGIVPPIPKQGGTPRAPNPFVRYTTAGQTLCLAKRVPRGRPSDGARAEIFTEVADMLTERCEFAGADYSWGDREFVRCSSAGARRTGRSTDWLAMATSHHLTHLAGTAPGPGETSPA